MNRSHNFRTVEKINQEQKTWFVSVKLGIVVEFRIHLKKCKECSRYTRSCTCSLMTLSIHMCTFTEDFNMWIIIIKTLKSNPIKAISNLCFPFTFFSPFKIIRIYFILLKAKPKHSITYSNLMIHFTGNLVFSNWSKAADTKSNSFDVYL